MVRLSGLRPHRVLTLRYVGRLSLLRSLLRFAAMVALVGALVGCKDDPTPGLMAGRTVWRGR